MEHIKNQLKYLAEKKPEKLAEIVAEAYKKDPRTIEQMLDYPEDAEHIASRQQYDELVKKIKWAGNEGHGAKWNFEDIKKNAKVNFDHVDYTPYDFAYLVNMLFAKCHKYITDPSVYLKLAKCFLEDEDEENKIYKGAYQNKHQHHRKGSQSYYNGDYENYEEEDRRRRRYRNEGYNNTYNDDRFDDYNRRGRNESSYYKESNMGFNS